MTPVSVCHDSFYVCSMTNPYVCHVVFIQLLRSVTPRYSLNWDGTFTKVNCTWVPQHPRDTHTHNGLPGIDSCWDDVFTESTGVGFHITITVHTHTHTWTPRYGFPLGWGVYKVNSSGLPQHINPGPTSRDPSPAGCCVCEWF